MRKTDKFQFTGENDLDFLVNNDNRKSKFKVFRRQLKDLQANFNKKFADFCCNDLVAKISIRFLYGCFLSREKAYCLFDIL